MSRRTTRATKAAAAATPGVSTATSNNNATTRKDQAIPPATNTKPPTTKKRRKTTTHTAVAVPDPRAPKRARNGYELFLLAGVDLEAKEMVRVFMIFRIRADVCTQYSRTRYSNMLYTCTFHLIDKM